MSSPLKQIDSLIPSLPTKDSQLARKFREEKNWESLKDLTWSCLQRIEIAIAKNKVPDKYKGIDLDKVRELALLCDEYYYFIYPEEMEIEEDFDEVEEDD